MAATAAVPEPRTPKSPAAAFCGEDVAAQQTCATCSGAALWGNTDAWDDVRRGAGSWRGPVPASSGEYKGGPEGVSAQEKETESRWEPGPATSRDEGEEVTQD